MNPALRRALSVNASSLLSVLVWPLIRLLAALAVVSGLLIVATICLGWWYRHDTMSIRPEGQPSLDGMATFYERGSPNLSARKLEALAAPLGIRVAPSTAKNRTIPTAPLAAREGELRKEFRGLLDGFIERADDEIPTIPESIHTFLGEHRHELAAIEYQTLYRPLPAWELDPHQIDGPLPGLLGLTTLVRLLAFRAIESFQNGCMPGAEQSLQAAWRLNESLLERPELIALLIYRANDSLVHRLVRVLPGLSPGWPERLSRFDPTARLAIALRWEAPMIVRHFFEELGPPDGFIVRGVRGSMRPYLEMCGWEHARRMEALAANHTSLSYCGLTPDALEAMWNPGAPKWNIVSRIAWPELSGSTARMLRRRLDQELTTIIVFVRAGNVGADMIPSRACPGNAWIVRTSPVTGATTVELGIRVFDPIKKALAQELALRYVQHTATP